MKYSDPNRLVPFISLSVDMPFAFDAVVNPLERSYQNKFRRLARVLLWQKEICDAFVDHGFHGNLDHSKSVLDH